MHLLLAYLLSESHQGLQDFLTSYLGRGKLLDLLPVPLNPIGSRS